MCTQDHAWKTQYTRINKSYERKYHKFEAMIFFRVIKELCSFFIRFLIMLSWRC